MSAGRLTPERLAEIATDAYGYGYGPMIRELLGHIAAIEKELFHLAAYQCTAPNNDEHGHVYCEKDAQIAALQHEIKEAADQS